MPSSLPTVTVRALAPIQAALREVRCEPSAVLAEAGIASPLLSDAEARISAEQFERVWAVAVAASKRQDLGLLAGTLIDFPALDVIGYLSKTSATLRDALLRASRYTRLLTTWVSLCLDTEGDDAIIAFVGPPASRAIIDFRVALWVRVSKLVLGDLPSLRIELSYPEPRDTRPYLRTLGCVPKFARARDAIRFRAALLDIALPGADPALCAILEREADRTLESLPADRRIAATVQQAMAAELGHGVPSLKRIAARLGMSARTLRRHLHDEGTSHRVLLDDLRCRMAERYLELHDLSVHEVAVRLGFADASAFNKAYRRWAGRSPRAKLKTGPSLVRGSPSRR
jgi:AraC-like DNA-binding protein